MERRFEGSSPLKKPVMEVSEKETPTEREVHTARRDIFQFKEKIKGAESAKFQLESELSGATKNVQSLVSRIEESNSRVKKIQELEKRKGRKEEMGSIQRETDNGQYADVMREVENIKKEVSKLKLDMACVLEEKRRAEKEAEASCSKVYSYANAVEAFRKEMDELNEEHVLVELARIEALKENDVIETHRKEQVDKYSLALAETRKKVSEEIAHAKELETKLAAANNDVDALKNELAMLKAVDIQRKESLKQPESKSLISLNSVLEELEVAKKEYAVINEEGFQLMASMDITRDELKHLVQEVARLRKTEEKKDLTIQTLNSKLLRAKAKLEALSAAEERANSITSSLAGTLERMKTEAETANKEREIIAAETAKIKDEVPKTEAEVDLAEANLEAAVEEVEAVKSSEAMVLENLKTLVEKSMRARAWACQNRTTITISAFEYEYLKGRAAGAEEVADKKVAAAQAWVEALKASEREILMRTEITKREIRELKLDEEHKVHKKEWPVSAKTEIKDEVQNLGKKHDKSLTPEKFQFEIASSRKSTSRNGISTPGRRPTFRKSASPAGRSMSRPTSTKVDRRRKVMPNLTHLFNSNNIERDH